MSVIIREGDSNYGEVSFSVTTLVCLNRNSKLWGNAHLPQLHDELLSVIHARSKSAPCPPAVRLQRGISKPCPHTPPAA
jgi:hypothetical protein